MTFDQLWRRNLRRGNGSVDQDLQRREIEVAEVRDSGGTVLDPDPAEVDRFIEWLEKTLV